MSISRSYAASSLPALILTSTSFTLIPSILIAAEPAAEEEAVDKDDMTNDAQTSDKAVEGNLAKPKKSAVDDFWEEMKRGAEVKKPAAQAAKKDISSFINGLVSKSAGGSAAASKGGKVCRHVCVCVCVWACV